MKTEDKVMYEEDFNSALLESNLRSYLHEPKYSERCKEEEEAAVAAEAAHQPAAEIELDKPPRLADSRWCLQGNCTPIETEME